METTDAEKKEEKRTAETLRSVKNSNKSNIIVRMRHRLFITASANTHTHV